MVNIIPDIKVGNLGTKLRVRITKIRDDVLPSEITGDEDQREPVDLTTSTDTFIELEKPKGNRVPLLDAIIIDAVNGLIEHDDNEGGFDVDGRWKIRGVAQFDTGNRFKGTWTGFRVSD